MNGNHRETLVSSGLRSPNGLTLDLPNKKMYWADSILDNVLDIDHYELYQYYLYDFVLQIQVSNLDGSSQRVLATISGAPFGLALDGNSLYWTDRQSLTIYRTVLGSSTNTSTYFKTASVPYEISLYDSTRSGGIYIYGLAIEVHVLAVIFLCK